MSKLLFKLSNVPEDEAEDVRDILQKNELEFFETSAGNWGISLPAIWIQHSDDFARARQLINDYQVERSIRKREELALNRQRGEARTMWHTFRDNPLRFVAYMSVIGAVIFLSLKAFMLV